MGLPDGVTLAQVLAVLIPVGVVTVFLREFPFIAKRLLRDSPFIGMLGLTMPIGVVTVLVIYTFGGRPVLPVLLAAAFTVALHWWRRNPGLSIFAGTAFYMLLVNVVWSG